VPAATLLITRDASGEPSAGCAVLAGSRSQFTIWEAHIQ
jgi:hypothetical protein